MAEIYRGKFWGGEGDTPLLMDLYLAYLAVSTRWTSFKSPPFEWIVTKLALS